ncbi:MAG: hypothetical protein R3308_11305, partial [Thiohalobacterales bacterium]|nr:hypothetical protein [Thiohalobacterales bacterium]
SLEAGPATSIVTAFGHRGNIGFTDTDPIDLRYEDNITEADLTVETVSAVPDPPPGTIEINGDITSGVPGVQASRVEIEASDASCQRTATGYACWITGSNPRLTLTGYYKANTDVVACSSSMTEQHNNDNANDPRTIFDLNSAEPTTSNHITLLTGTSCGV